MTLTEQRHRAHTNIISIFPHTLSFPILYPSTSIMCFQTIPVLSQPRSKNTRNGNVILLTCALFYIFYYTSFFLCGSLELPVICQQSWLHFCFFLTIHTQHLGLDWDLDSSRRLSYPGCSLSQFLFLSHPKASWPGWGHWSAHFKQLEILNPLSPRQSQLIWISCDYCNLL